jgi:hypothetical protein
VLPDPNHQPACACQRLCLPPVTDDIAVKLRLPEPVIRRWHLAVSGTRVPETAVDEYCDALSRKRDIRPYKLSVDSEREILAESEASGVKR